MPILGVNWLGNFFISSVYIHLSQSNPSISLERNILVIALTGIFFFSAWFIRKELQGKTCVSAANSCGLTDAAKYLCDGSCFATPPSDDLCVPPTITISTLKSFTDKGKPCTIKWSTTDATSCTLSGPGVSVSGTSGQIDTPPLQVSTTYTLSCQNGPTVTSSKEVICYLTPHLEEF